MRSITDLLDEQRDAEFPPEIEKGRNYGTVDPVMIDADIYGRVLNYVSGFQLDGEARACLEQARLELGHSFNELPNGARPYYARLLRLADVAVQGCDALPSPAPPLRSQVDLLARMACNGETMWARSHSGAALQALSSAGFEILGLDLRKYPHDGGTYEAPWSDVEGDDSTSNLEAAQRSLATALGSELTDYPWILITYRPTRLQRHDPHGSDLTDAEIELLVDGLTDDVSFDMALLHLGIRGNSPDRNEAPDAAQIEAVFRSYERLINNGLIQLGRVQYIDGGPPGRVAPVEHVEEPLREVRTRVDHACSSATDWADWAFGCWTVNTEGGDAIARKQLGVA